MGWHRRLREAHIPGTMRLLEPDLIRELQRRVADADNAVDHRFADDAIPARPLDTAGLEVVEERLGFALPEALRDIYLNVANGGFGPGYGLLGVGAGATDDLGNTADSLYVLFDQPDPADPEWSWRPHVIPFAYWGCAVYSCITPAGTVIGFDGEEWVDEETPLDTWLRSWLDGSLKQPSASS